MKDYSYTFSTNLIIDLSRPELQDRFDRIFIISGSARSEYKIEEIDFIQVTTSGTVFLQRKGSLYTIANANVTLRKKVEEK